MSLKCHNCGYEIRTRQEVLTFISQLITRVIFHINDLMDIRTLLRGGGGIPRTGLKIRAGIGGICAGPFNDMGITCPQCGRTSRWDDCDDSDTEEDFEDEISEDEDKNDDRFGKEDK